MQHIISLAYDSETREEVIHYVQAMYKKTYGTIPGESEVYIFSKYGDIMTGAFALDFMQPNGRMPLEEIYSVDLNDIPFEVRREKSVQFCKWIASDPAVSTCISYYATLYSLTQGKEYIWLTQIDKTHRVLRQKGIVFYPLTRAELRRDNIPEGDKLFYESHECPKCYISNAIQQRDALKKRSDEILEKGYVIFDTN